MNDYNTSNDEVYYAMLRAAWACEDCNGQGHNFVPGACKTCQTCRSLRDALLTVRGPFMSLDSKPGDKVRYHWGLAGYDGDVSYARKHLTLGAVYTIKRLDVYDSTSTLLLEEVLGGFNPVQFAPLAENETGLSACWQPIETAPKDGRTLLLGYFNSAGKWRTMRGQWYSQAMIEDEWEEPENGHEGWYESSVEKDDPPNLWQTEPTHWQPTPKPPALAGKETVPPQSEQLVCRKCGSSDVMPWPTGQKAGGTGS